MHVVVVCHSIMLLPVHSILKLKWALDLTHCSLLHSLTCQELGEHLFNSPVLEQNGCNAAMAENLLKLVQHYFDLTMSMRHKDNFADAVFVAAATKWVRNGQDITEMDVLVGKRERGTLCVVFTCVCMQGNRGGIKDWILDSGSTNRTSSRLCMRMEAASVHPCAKQKKAFLIWSPLLLLPGVMQSSVDKQASLEATLEEQNREIQRLCKRLGLNSSGSRASVEGLSKKHAEISAACASPVVEMEVTGEVQSIQHCNMFSVNAAISKETIDPLIAEQEQKNTIICARNAQIASLKVKHKDTTKAERHRDHHDHSIQVKDEDDKKDELMEENEMVPNTEESESYMREDQGPLTDARARVHAVQHPADGPWAEMLTGRRGAVKYVGTTHAHDEVSSPIARDAEDAKLTGTVRRARWVPGKWRVCALVDRHPHSTTLGWRRLSQEQDAERVLIALGGPWLANTATGGLHLRYSPNKQYRRAVQRLLCIVPSGRPEAASRDPNVEELVRKHHAMVVEHETMQMAPAALERSIDMASCASCPRPDRLSMIIYKDNTVEDLANEADDFGLFGWGCGQGPERIQHNLAMVDFHQEAWPYDGVTRASNPPAYASRFAIDFWPHGRRHTKVLLHLIAALRMIIATGACIICLSSSEVTFFLLRRVKDTLKHLKGVLGPQGLADVLLGRMSLQAFAEAVFEPSKYGYKLLMDPKHAGFSITEEAGRVIKYWHLLCKHYSRLCYIETAIFCLAEHHGGPAMRLMEQINKDLDLYKMLIKTKQAIHALVKVKPLYYVSTTQPSLALLLSPQGNDHLTTQAWPLLCKHYSRLCYIETAIFCLAEHHGGPAMRLMEQINKNPNLCKMLIETKQAIHALVKVKPLYYVSTTQPSSALPLTLQGNDHLTTQALQVNRSPLAHIKSPTAETRQGSSKRALPTKAGLQGNSKRPLPANDNAPSSKRRSADDESILCAYKSHLWIAGEWMEHVPLGEKAGSRTANNGTLRSSSALPNTTRASRAASKENKYTSSSGTIARAATTKQTCASSSRIANNPACPLNWPLAHGQQSLFLGAPGSMERAQQFDNDLFMPYPRGKTMEEGCQWFLEQVEGHQIGPSIGGANSSDLSFQAREGFDQRAYRLAKAAAAAGGEAMVRKAPWEDTSASMNGHKPASQKTTSWSLDIEHRDLVRELDKLHTAGLLSNGLPTAALRQLAAQHKVQIPKVFKRVGCCSQQRAHLPGSGGNDPRTLTWGGAPGPLSAELVRLDVYPLSLGRTQKSRRFFPANIQRCGGYQNHRLIAIQEKRLKWRDHTRTTGSSSFESSESLSTLLLSCSLSILAVMHLHAQSRFYLLDGIWEVEQLDSARECKDLLYVPAVFRLVEKLLNKVSKTLMTQACQPTELRLRLQLEKRLLLFSLAPESKVFRPKFLLFGKLFDPQPRCCLTETPAPPIQPLDAILQGSRNPLDCCSTRSKSMIIMKDITVEDLRNNADNYGLHSSENRFGI
ncbi:hypothetical protein IE81DRAFT_332871 [Ceraceosorus guamensis]|uniref:SAP domain-containing protein n=1 Tax=Ceraceosorus guamensis TaxID=1522189 RepID=A0A316VT36_9BASI|nr:hypothetical protein IE81DRAFT_332871 [Ceraceosorus guamensis]PWN38675.1 hypothetical protein IE81DRAFT_332871 [Ceraceosorus guamensis]